MKPMNWKTAFFGFGGRVNRAKYWLVILANIVVWIAFIVLANILRDSVESFDGLSRISLLFGISGFTAIAFSLWTGFAVAVKRLHDRARSAWWIVLYWLVPIALGIAWLYLDDFGGLAVAGVSLAILLWGFVEIALLKGTAGANAYGPDPLAR
ncbi:DUF805 domain-containing protein [Afipia sp. P52-10]|uniref:DUF805 domain-containing protein n=1 Tax=Afipia sp. P52-10 TaxID=1429916 RepID=UPI0009DD9FE6